MHKHTNQLIHETSPYLLQHAHNPVNWYAWDEAAFEKAKAEEKPVLVSIGYSSCHWCHVMEHESFEDEATAAIMNEHFINIKIDREERPDLDHIYMDAVQAMTGSGGWPLNVFLTPDKKPFYGGTYFPPKPAFNRPSWTDLLLSISKTFKEKRHEIEAQAENLTEHLSKSNSFGLQYNEAARVFTTENASIIFKNIMQNADRQWGGFGKAPKFPQSFVIQYLLRYYSVTGDAEALQQAQLSLDKMIEGGIYDQVGGGFARYSTDAEWLVPHFEKMLYDNALLINVLAEVYQLTGNIRYKDVIEETVSFIEREMMDISGGFYSALDADSEGVEGKFYVWTKKEVESILGNDAKLYCEFYDITEKGNWEHQNILWIKKSRQVFANENGISEEDLKAFLKKCNDILLSERGKRVRPGLDDKILLSWNALINTALSKAYAATGINHYKDLAVMNMEFLLNTFKQKSELLHTYKNGQAKYEAFLDDYAFLIDALIHLQEITAERKYLQQAKELTLAVIENFSEDETAYFYYTHKNQKDVIVRKKEVYDGAVASANAVMAYNLYRLGILFDERDWISQAEKMVLALANAIIKYPSSFGVWASLCLQMINGTSEIVITGKNIETTVRDFLQVYLPHKIFMAANKEEDYPLLQGKSFEDEAQLFLCRNYTCYKPVTSIGKLLEMLKSQKNNY